MKEEEQRKIKIYRRNSEGAKGRGRERYREREGGKGKGRERYRKSEVVREREKSKVSHYSY